jgi:prepilin-type N-terminal cleavage/methylation domain-containing protein
MAKFLDDRGMTLIEQLVALGLGALIMTGTVWLFPFRNLSSAGA